MKRLLTITALLACAVAPAAIGAADSGLPRRVDIEFAVYMGSVRIGEGTDHFEHDGRTYRISSESSTAGLAAIYRMQIKREARGQVTPAGLRPETYSEMRNGKVKRSVRFDWDRKQATLYDGEKSKVVPLPERTWDTTSFGYNFTWFRPDGKELTVNLTDGRRINEYEYAVVGRERLDTEIGSIETLHMKKVQDDDDKRGFEVWLAVERHYAPVRIRYIGKDGTVFDSKVTKLAFSS